MPFSSMSTPMHLASNISKISTECTKVGDSTRITSPGSIYAWQVRLMPSRPPVMIMTLSTPQSMPLGASSSRATTSRRSPDPSMGPYCRASRPGRLSAGSRPPKGGWCPLAGPLAGEPPLKEMMSGLVMDPNSPLTTLAVKAIFFHTLGIRYHSALSSLSKGPPFLAAV